MIRQPKSKIILVTGISNDERQSIDTYLLGKIDTWFINQDKIWQSSRTIMGGLNRKWEGTPLYVLFLKHIRNGKNIQVAQKCASQDFGRLLYSLVENDERLFETRNNFDHIRQYRII